MWLGTQKKRLVVLEDNPDQEAQRYGRGEAGGLQRSLRRDTPSRSLTLALALALALTLTLTRAATCPARTNEVRANAMHSTGVVSGAPVQDSG